MNRTCRSARVRFSRPVIGGLSDQDVHETVRLLSGEARLEGLHQLAVREVPKALAGVAAHLVRREILDGAPEEHLADDGRSFDDDAIDRAEPVEACGQERLDRRRDRDGTDVPDQDPSVVVIAFQDPVVEKHREHLLDEERVAFGGLDDLRLHCRVEVGASQQVLGHLHALVIGERLQDEDVMPIGLLAPVGMDIEEVGARRAGEHDRNPRDRGGDRPDQVEERPLRPVDVVDQHDQGLPRRHDLEETPSGPERLFHGIRGGGQADRPGEAIGHVAPLISEQLRELLQRVGRRVVVVDACRGPRDLGQRPERQTLPVRQAPPAHRPRVGLRDELLEQPGLAGPGRRDDGHHVTALGVDRAGESAGEHLQFVLPPDHRSIEVPSHAFLLMADGDEPIGGHRLGLALELERLHFLRLDRVLDQAVRLLSEEDLHRRSVLFEARGDVHGVAGHEPMSDAHVTGHHLAGVHARPVLEPDAVDLLETGVDANELFLHLGGGPDRAERVVLVELRQPEDRHDRVSDVLLDGPTVLLQHGAHRVEVLVQDLAKGLGVQPLGEGRGSLQVREDDRDGLADLFGDDLDRGQLGAAHAAHAEPIRVLLTATRTGLHCTSLRPTP